MSEKENLKAVVAISVEVALMRIRGPEYQNVISHLDRDYEMSITDCFDNPDKLKETIKEVYGKFYPKVISEIETELTGQASGEEVESFLLVLKS